MNIYKEAQKPSRLTFLKKQQAQLPLGRTPKSRLTSYIAQEHPKWYNCKSLWRSSLWSMKNTHTPIRNKNQGNGNVQQGFFAPHSSLENKWKKALGRVNLNNIPLLTGWDVFPLLFDWAEWSITSLKWTQKYIQIQGLLMFIMPIYLSINESCNIWTQLKKYLS